MKKKLLLITLMFLTLGKFAMASSRLPDGSIPDERLMRKLRSAVRLLASYYGTDKDMEGQADSRRFITKVMNNRKYNSYVPLAFNDVYVEDMEDWENANVFNPLLQNEVRVDISTKVDEWKALLK